MCFHKMRILTNRNVMPRDSMRPLSNDNGTENKNEKKQKQKFSRKRKIK